MGAMNVLSLPLMVGWGAWVLVGAALFFWARRVHDAASVPAPRPRTSVPRPAARPKSGVRPPDRPPTRPDAFGDLRALLDPPTSAGRRPGD